MSNSFDLHSALSALSLCMTVPDNLADDPCRRCPLYPCDPDERLQAFRDLLLSVAPDLPQAAGYAHLLSLCLEDDEAECASCPYADRCQSADPTPLLLDVFRFLKESGCYEKETV